MHAPPGLHIARQDASGAACALLARAMRDNPTHVAVFGPEAARRQQRLQAFFFTVLPWIGRHGLLLAASHEDELVGILGLLPPGSCQPRGWQRVRLGVGLLRRQHPACTLRALRWLHAWHRSDPPTAHWHLGPLAVTPHQQGRGIGSALLAHGLARIGPTPAYLETDLPRNVTLYQRLGFAVISEKTVLGVPNWFMRRGA